MDKYTFMEIQRFQYLSGTKNSENRYIEESKKLFYFTSWSDFSQVKVRVKCLPSFCSLCDVAQKVHFCLTWPRTLRESAQLNSLETARRREKWPRFRANSAWISTNSAHPINWLTDSTKNLIHKIYKAYSPGDPHSQLINTPSTLHDSLVAGTLISMCMPHKYEYGFVSKSLHRWHVWGPSGNTQI